jgi:signal transduction histidine kinase
MKMNSDQNAQSNSESTQDKLSSLLCSIIRYSSLATSKIDFLKKESLLIIDFLGCDGINLQLSDYERIFEFEVKRQKRPPNEMIENFHISKIMSIHDIESKEFLDLKSLSNLLLKTKYELTGNDFTVNGSFYTKEAKGLYEIGIKNDNESIIRFYRIESGYRSIAAIPIKAKGEVIGILQLKAQVAGFFTDNIINVCETISEAVGSAALDKNRNSKLRERIKELECMYGISKILEVQDLYLNDILDRIVKLLPPSWLYPEITAAKILLDKEIYTANQFENASEKLSSDIIVDSKKRGTVEVAYLKEMPEIYEGPFLFEERKLLDAIARQISQIIKRKSDEEENIRLQEQIRHADRLATIGELSAGVAHEINEPLANILGFSQILLDDINLSEQTTKDIRKIESASLHAREVVKKLLFFSRQMPQNKTLVNINQVINDTFFFLESRCVKEGIKVLKKFDSEIPEIMADSSQIQQIVINLVVNAVQAMSNGDTLSLSTHYENGNLSLIVEDTGVGMSEDVKKQLFVPFFTTKDVNEGTGLGLPVVHGIVTSHAGSIDVYSEVGKGTRFEIKLPVDTNTK